MLDSRPTVILADDHPMMLEGLCRLLESTLEVVATAADGGALVEAAARLRPDLVIADISMPDVDGIEATRRLGTASPETRVLILSLHAGPSWVRMAFDAGAWAYLTKGAAAEEIEGAVREVLADRFYISPSVTRAFLSPSANATEVPKSAAATDGEVLTPREVEVTRLVGQGLPNKQIASQLGVSVTTVRSHLNSVYEKLGQSNRVELALYAARAAAGER